MREFGGEKTAKFDIQKLKQIVETYGIKCSICGLKQFTAEQNPQSLNTVDLEKKSTSFGSGYVLALMSCNNCGYVMPFRASKLQE